MYPERAKAHGAPLERTGIGVEGYKHGAPLEHFRGEKYMPKPFFVQSQIRESQH